MDSLVCVQEMTLQVSVSRLEARNADLAQLIERLRAENARLTAERGDERALLGAQIQLLGIKK
jgi:uncharacterized small protein (DUF1192 family)